MENEKIWIPGFVYSIMFLFLGLMFLIVDPTQTKVDPKYVTATIIVVILIYRIQKLMRNKYDYVFN